VTAPFRIEPLAGTHDRRAFQSGVELLDRYFHERVTQDIRRRLSNCFVALDDAGIVAGYYLSATSLAMTELRPMRASACRVTLSFPLA